MTTDVLSVAAQETALTTTEQAELARCEQLIDKGLETFIQVGEALQAIRDQRLYRAQYADFASYVRERWPDIGGRRQADRLIAAAEVQQNLGPIGLSLSNESQARPLAGLPPVEQRAAMQEAVATAPEGKVTAAHIQATVDKRQGKTPAAPPPAPRAPSPPADDEVIEGEVLAVDEEPSPTASAASPVLAPTLPPALPGVSSPASATLPPALPGLNAPSTTPTDTALVEAGVLYRLAVTMASQARHTFEALATEGQRVELDERVLAAQAQQLLAAQPIRLAARMLAIGARVVTEEDSTA